MTGFPANRDKRIKAVYIYNTIGLKFNPINHCSNYDTVHAAQRLASALA